MKKGSYLIGELIVGESIHESPFGRTLDDVTVLGLDPTLGYDLQLSVRLRRLNLFSALLVRSTNN
jgi:hypothetical protein